MLISEMKRSEVSVDMLREVSESLEDSSFLKYKLKDIVTLFSLYEEAIAGKYLDSEDYITFYGDKMLVYAEEYAGAGADPQDGAQSEHRYDMGGCCKDSSGAFCKGRCRGSVAVRR